MITRSKRDLLHTAVPVAFCVLVFFFALHAKTAVYGGAASPKVTTATASKLWVNSQKIDGRAAQSHAAPLFWLLFVSIVFFGLHRRAWLPSAVASRPASNLPLWHRHRFLRPPPFLG